MKLLVVNPLGHDRFDLSDAEFVAARLAPGDSVSVASLPEGETYLHDFHALALAAPRVAEVVAALSPGHDAVVINCFADPGLEAAREVSTAPVLGPGQTCLKLVRLLSRRFGVVAAGGRSLAVVQRNLEPAGSDCGLVGVEPLPIPVEGLSQDPARTTGEMLAAVERLAARGAGAAVLGCTGMSRLFAELCGRTPIPVLEPLSTAVAAAKALVRLKLSHARLNLPAERPPAGAPPVTCLGTGKAAGRRLVVLNPVTRSDLAPRVSRYLAGLVSEKTEVRVESIRVGPPFIESALDAAQAAPGLLELVEALAEEARAGRSARPDALIVNCYADPGLEAVQEASRRLWGCRDGWPSVPAVGLGTASSVVAALLARRFSVVAVGRGGAGPARDQVRALGLAPSLARVVEARLGVEELLSAPQDAQEALADGVRRAVREPGDEAVAFGCGGAMEAAVALRRRFPGIPLVEPLAAAVGVAEVLAELGQPPGEAA
ncbi:MAG: aspartate/glutamate racemase family protein [Acetobacteraceae bacterium]|nr:aspartate/glutamate racemase family protein [Acetobacteraceae bacterium]